LLGLFDRPATPDCIAALRQPPVIPNLTDSLINLSDAQWNLAIKRLGGLGLIEEQPWEPRPLVGYSLEQASAAREATGRKEWYELPEPKPLENRHSHMANLNSLDAHPLIREFFAKRLRETRAVASKAAHSRLFDELRDSAPYWPEGLDGLQPLYQAVAHGCQAGRYKEACEEVYIGRILRGTDGNYMHYSKFNLGAIGADLAAVGCFFVSPWMQLAPELSETIKAWLLHEAAYSLRSAGRLIEAREAQARNLEMRIREGAVQHLPSSAVNLSDLDLILGDVESAVRESRQSMDFADESKEVQQRMLAQANLANALHLAGQASESAKLFVEAEIVQRQLQPETPILYSLRGFSYCDLLLSGAETAAWRVFLKPGSEMGNLDLAESCRAVVTRATQTLSWVISVRWLLHIALDNLTLGRAMLYAALLDDSARNGLQSAGEHLDEAIHGLQRAARLPYVPPGLLTRAWLHVLQDEPQKARQLLDDAWQIAERGPMRLQLADVHLHRARLFLRADPYPWNTNPDGGRRGPGDDLRAARKLITDCGYGRRVTELQDAERALAER
jgi:tetratricopeptide (TPR) repeat protein